MACAVHYKVFFIDLCYATSLVSGCLITLGLASEFGFDNAPQGGNLIEEIAYCWYLQVGKYQVD